MNNVSMGKNYINDAKIIFEEAKDSLSRGHYHRTVRKCQESTELASKGLLRIAGIEYPKSHKVGKVLLESPLKEKIESETLKKMAQITDDLSANREIAFYGTETEAPEELFSKSDAEEVISNSEFIFSNIDKLLKEAGL
ncbi:HEPN domain-containing protein [Thermodesulfovibrionales bacterium]|nr:HEPN domain-containing protein [Thermodesulfovibrionales bacterium]